jgi:hypothetical protein
VCNQVTEFLVKFFDPSNGVQDVQVCCTLMSSRPNLAMLSVIIVHARIVILLLAYQYCLYSAHMRIIIQQQVIG